jgi:enamine deaminase RidA (YjgF/YER057c/UK114 family)
MQRTAVNPWDWSLKLGYHQAEIIEGARRQLICAGQTSVDGAGNPQHAGDMRGQIGLALDNLEAVLKGAGMGLGDVVRLTVYATDVDEALKNFDLMGMRFGPARNAPPMTLVGVTRLAIPPLMFEIEATAMV